MKQILEYGEKIIKEYVNAEQIPGAAYAFISEEDVEQGFYGYRSLKPKKEKLTADTLYDLASLSKVVSTSVMILKLHEEGLIHFHDKVADILEEYPYKEVRILDLLVHTSGMFADDKNYKKCRNGDELWQFILSLPLHQPTGTKVEYSCLGYITLGRIIEHFKGDMEKYAKEVLFDKLETSDLLYNPKKKGRENDCVTEEYNEKRGYIKGEVHDGKAFINGGVSGNAGVFGNIEALSRFVKMMLNDGVYKDKRILDSKTMELFRRCYTEGLNERRTMGSWYYGDHSTTAGHYISACSLYHTGFTGTSIYIDYERKCGIVLLCNAVHMGRDNPMKEIRIKFHDAILKALDEEGKK